MADGKNVTARVTETRNGNLLITRELIKDKHGKPLKTKDGADFYGYFVRGFIRGQEKKVDLAGKDKGGYEPLELMFGIQDKAELIVTEEETEFNGMKTHRTIYTAQVVDEDDEVWKCEVKPQRNSDKALLDFLMIEVGKQNRKQTA